MGTSRLDVLVVGAGPAGSTAALGSRPRRRPGWPGGQGALPAGQGMRGPRRATRGLQVLADLGVPEPPGLDVGDMLVVGPDQPQGRPPVLRRDHLPRPGPRHHPDSVRRRTAQRRPRCRRRTRRGPRRRPPLVRCAASTASSSTAALRCTPTSSSGPTAPPAMWRRSPPSSRRHGVLWGFAVRCYVDQPCRPAGHHAVGARPLARLSRLRLDLPRPRRRRQPRHRASGPWRTAEAVRRQCSRAPRIRRASSCSSAPRSGPRCQHCRAGWGGGLKMGVVGTTPAAGTVLLVGGTAGLVNPLQGEGIAPAMTSGRAANRGHRRRAGHAAAHYRLALARSHLPYHRVAATGHAALVGRPRAVTAVGRILTAPRDRHDPRGQVGDLLERASLAGAAPGRARRVAATSTWVGSRRHPDQRRLALVPEHGGRLRLSVGPSLPYLDGSRDHVRGAGKVERT